MNSPNPIVGCVVLGAGGTGDREALDGDLSVPDDIERTIRPAG